MGQQIFVIFIFIFHFLFAKVLLGCSCNSAPVTIRTRVPEGQQPSAADHRGRNLPDVLYDRLLHRQNSA